MATHPDNHDDTNRELVAFRAPRPFVDAIRKIARDDGETVASTIRALLRRGIEHRDGRAAQ